MGFLKSLKGKFQGEEQRDDLSSPQYQSPEISYDSRTTKREKQEIFGPSDQGNNSSQQYKSYTAPSGPPPSSHQDTFEPPSGPPPSHQQQQQQQANPPPYQDWLQVPDNSQLPPPPGIRSELSPTNNASEDSANAGLQWCDENPLYMAAMPSSAIYESVKKGNLVLQAPRHFRGKLKKEHSVNATASSSQYHGVPPISAIYSIKSPPRADDASFLTTLPMYFAARDNPIVRDSATPKSVSFGIKILEFRDANAVIGVGFAGKPYPPFRQPGWHRCSLAIHADDGRRYINDDGGGLEFVRPFQAGDVIKVTIVFYPQYSPVVEDTVVESTVNNRYPRCKTRVEFERNGYPEGGWDVHEERDADLPGIEGLQGEDDLYAAVGACGACQFEVLFWPQGEL